MYTDSNTEKNQTSEDFTFSKEKDCHFDDDNISDINLKWTLLEEDIAFIRQFRTAQYWRFIAIQLCHIRETGRFYENNFKLSYAVIQSISRQLELDPELFITLPDREETKRNQLNKIREYLNLKWFNEKEDVHILEEWMLDFTFSEIKDAEIYKKAELFLIENSFELPPKQTFKELIGSIRKRVEPKFFQLIDSELSDQQKNFIQKILTEKVEEGKITQFQLFKIDPKNDTPKYMREWIRKFELIKGAGFCNMAFNSVNDKVLDNFAEIGHMYDASALLEFESEKRNAITACFLIKFSTKILDYIIDMQISYTVGLEKDAKNKYSFRVEEAREETKSSRLKVEEVVTDLLSKRNEHDLSVPSFIDIYGFENIKNALEANSKLSNIEKLGAYEDIAAKYSSINKISKELIKIPYKSTIKNDPIINAIELLRQYESGTINEIKNPPLSFIPEKWRQNVYPSKGNFDRNTWEMFLFIALAGALKRGDIFLVESDKYRPILQTIFGEEYDNKKSKNKNPKIPKELQNLKNEFFQNWETLKKAFPGNDFFKIDKDKFNQPYKISLTRDYALEITPAIKQLRALFSSKFKKIRIEDLMINVHNKCGFLSEFNSGLGVNKIDNYFVLLAAALVSHGTNLGNDDMAAVSSGISVDQLNRITKWSLRPVCIKSANTCLVNYHGSLPFSEVYGPGKSASSDGQRFAVERKHLLARPYPRYFGTYDSVISIYTHILDKQSVFGTKVISCLEREALYVLCGLIENETNFKPEIHSTDTHGYTDHLFGLMWLLGFSFRPRIADLGDSRRFWIKELDIQDEYKWFFDGNESINLIAEQWENLKKLEASLKSKQFSADLIMTRLIRPQHQNRLSRALVALGRIAKTTYIMRYLVDEKMRYEVQLQLNRGEFRHALVRKLFFANQGKIRANELYLIMNKANCLSLLSNSVLIHNTIEMEKITLELRNSGMKISDEDLARVSPLMYDHIIPTGSYDFSKFINL